MATIDRPTRFVFVDLETMQTYHRDRMRIAKDWPACPGDPELWAVHATMRRAAMANLREDVKRALTMGLGGEFPIPV